MALSMVWTLEPNVGGHTDRQVQQVSWNAIPQARGRAVMEQTDLSPEFVRVLSGALISNDGARRFLLWRRWNCDGPRMLFIMLNPSTADGRTDDPTVRKCIGFARGAGCGGLMVVNLISQRSPKPAAVRAEPEPEEADRQIACALQCARIVAAWGTLGGLSREARQIAIERIALVRGFARVAGRRLECLSVTNGGQPGHPLFIPYSATLKPWPPVELPA